MDADAKALHSSEPNTEARRNFCRESENPLHARLWKLAYVHWTFAKPDVGSGLPNGIQLTLRCILSN